MLICFIHPFFPFHQPLAHFPALIIRFLSSYECNPRVSLYSNINLGPAGAQAIGEALTAVTSLTSLDIGYGGRLRARPSLLRSILILMSSLVFLAV